MNKQEYDNGYQAAIEAIKQSLSGSSSSSKSGNSTLDPRMTPPPTNSNNNGGSSSGSGSGSGNQGVVQPEDCVSGNSEISNTPSAAGGLISKSAGDAIAEKEGYEKEGPNEDGVEKSWKDSAMKNIGKFPGSLKSKIENIYKTSTNWKKELRLIVGSSISADNTRQAYANKNVLISQDRLAKTNKDKYDNLDYITVFIDTSGSMSQDQLLLCLREVYTVALMKKPMNLLIIQCDTKIQDVQEFNNIRELERSFKTATVKGGGGTELKPCWDYLERDPKMRRQYSELVMVFTDGYLTQYRRNPKTMKNLCWVILDNPSFVVENKERNTRCVYLNTKDVK